MRRTTELRRQIQHRTVSSPGENQSLSPWFRSYHATFLLVMWLAANPLPGSASPPPPLAAAVPAVLGSAVSAVAESAALSTAVAAVAAAKSPAKGRPANPQPNPEQVPADEANGEQRGNAEERPALEKTDASGPSKRTNAGTRTARRLPRYFGKLDLVDSQREEIFRVQQQYQEEIERREIELAELKVKREAEVRQVLNEHQRTRLQELESESRTNARNGRESSGPTTDGVEQPANEVATTSEE